MLATREIPALASSREPASGAFSPFRFNKMDYIGQCLYLFQVHQIRVAYKLHIVKIKYDNKILQAQWRFKFLEMTTMKAGVLV